MYFGMKRVLNLKKDQDMYFAGVSCPKISFAANKLELEN